MLATEISSNQPPRTGLVEAGSLHNGISSREFVHNPAVGGPEGGACGALGGIRTPNLLIRSQMLYPLSYERSAVGPRIL